MEPEICSKCGKPITDPGGPVRVIYGGDELVFHLKCFRRWIWEWVFRNRPRPRLRTGPGRGG